MSDGDLNKRAASGAHAGHMMRARHYMAEARKCMGAGMQCCAMAAEGREEKAADGKVLKGADHLARALSHFDRAREHMVLAEHHMGAASGHVGEAGEQPGDRSAEWIPDAGLRPLAQRDLTGGDVPDYDPTRPYPGKSAVAEALKEAQAELLKKAEEAAYLRGHVEALQKLPGQPTARLFAVPGGIGDSGDADGGDAASIRNRGIDFRNITTPEAASKAAGRMITNMVFGGLGRSIIGDPEFRGNGGSGRRSAH